jgi:hypothetical protein
MQPARTSFCRSPKGLSVSQSAQPAARGGQPATGNRQTVPDAMEVVFLEGSNTNKQIDIQKRLSDSKWTVFDNNNMQDMTYGIVDKEHFDFDNKIPNSKQRDKILDQPNPNTIPILQNFTGVGLKPPKREVENMFKPEEYKNNPIKNFSEYADRYALALSQFKTKERPFEQQQIGPGVGLPADQDSLGGYHDTVRILPRSTNEMRRNDLPKITYDGRIIQGQKGSKRPIVGKTYKHLPAFFKEYKVDQLQKSGGINRPTY